MTTPDIHLRELVLEVRHAAARYGITDEMARRMDLTVWREEIAYRLVAQLAADVLSDRVLADEARVPCRGVVDTRELPTSALVELPRPWWARLLRRRPTRVWCPVVAGAAIHDAPDRLPIHGTATVRADYFRAFPDARVPYPDALGRGLVRIETTAPGPVTWTPPDPLEDGPDDRT